MSMGTKRACMKIDRLEMDKDSAAAFGEYVKKHDSGFLADLSDYPMTVEICGAKAFVCYVRIAEVDTAEFVNLLFPEES